MEWKLNTSNQGKLKEFQRLFSKHGFILLSTQFDLPEIESNPIDVVAHKASQLEERILVEDTSLDIEGAEVGINVRWLIDHLKDYQGKNAVWTVFLAYRLGEAILIYKGEVNGVIVQPRGEGGFGFDPVFLPNGSQKTLAEEKPDRYNARALAVEALIQNKKYMSVRPIYYWIGPWQKS